MNLRILASLSMIALASAALGYGTYAAFSDTETSSGNIFTVGSLDLQLDGGQSITATLGATNFAPGDVVSDTITLSNAGTILDGDAQNHVVRLDLTVSNVVTDDEGLLGDLGNGGDSDAAPLDTFLIVTKLTYGGTDLLADQSGPVTLHDLESLSFEDLADPGSGTTLEIEVGFDANAPSHLMRDVVDVTLTFVLRQVPVEA